MAQEVDGFQVFPAAVFIGLPVAVSMAVIEVEHVGDGVDAQAVDVELAEPEEGTGNEEGLDFRPAIVEIHRVPFLIFSQHGVARFIARFAVKMAQAVGVAAKMARYPVEDDADAVAVAQVDEIHQIFRLAIAAGRREIARPLIAPGAVEGIFAQRHELDVGIIHLFDIIDELGRYVAVRQHFPIFIAAPRAEMDFIGQHGLAVRIVSTAAVHPFLVAPRIVEFRQFRCRIGTYFRPEGVRIALQDAFPRCRRDGVFVGVPFLEAGNMCNPNAIAAAAPFHGVGISIPVIEITDNADLLRMRCPDGKAHTRLAAQDREMGPEQTITGVVRTLMIQEGTVLVDCTEFHILSS